MSRRLISTGVSVVLALGLVATVGAGVAVAKNGHGHRGDGTGGQSRQGGSGIPAGGHELGDSTTTTLGGQDAGVTTTTTLGRHRHGGTASVHGAKGGKKGTAVALTGTTTCSIHGKVTFNPPLKNGGTASTTVGISGLLSGCSNASADGARFNNGHLSALVGTLSSSDCAALASGTAPSLSGGSIVWTPPSKVASSTGLSFPAGSGSVVAANGKSVIQVLYSGGSVGGGSFTNSGSASMMLVSRQDTAQLTSRCSTGLTNVAFSGTATL